MVPYLKHIDTDRKPQKIIQTPLNKIVWGVAFILFRPSTVQKPTTTKQNLIYYSAQYNIG